MYLTKVDKSLFSFCTYSRQPLGFTEPNI